MSRKAIPSATSVGHSFRPPEGVEGNLVPVVRVHDAHESVGGVLHARLLGVQQRHQTYHVLPVAKLLPRGHHVESESHEGLVKQRTLLIGTTT